MEDRERKIFTYAVIISLLLHVIGFLVMNYSKVFSFTLPDDLKAEQTSNPIVLELEQPAPQEQPQQSREEETAPEEKKDIPDDYFLVEDNPNANKMDPVESNILSEKSSVSAAPQSGELERSKLPADQPNLIPPEESRLAQDEAEKQEDPGVETNETHGQVAVYSNKMFSKNLLTSQPMSDQQEEVKKDSLSSEPVSLLKDFKGDLIGDYALSTYEWKWAPWFLALKEKFYRYVFVPPAYGLGLIDGYTEVWLKIDRSGKLMDYKLLKYVGHPTLKESTINAFLASAPWKPLPADFPDPYLELRVRVIYPNLREYFEQQQGNNQQ